MSDARLAAQQDSLFRRDAPQVLAEIKAMIEVDQAIRNLHEYGTADPDVADSLSQLRNEAMIKAGVAPCRPMTRGTASASRRGSAASATLWRR